jgi:hypothetical protein
MIDQKNSFFEENMVVENEMKLNENASIAGPWHTDSQIHTKNFH